VHRDDVHRDLVVDGKIARFGLTRSPSPGFTTLAASKGTRTGRSGVIPSNRQLLVLWFLVWDVALVTGVFFLGLGEPAQRQLSGLTCLAILCMALLRLYSLHRLRRAREELRFLLQAMGLLLLLLLLLDLVPQRSRLDLAQLLGMATILLFCVRRIWWSCIGSLRARGYNPTPVIIVGTGRVARRAARGIRNAGWTGMHVLGFIEDEPSRWTSDLPILGAIADLPHLVLHHGISQVFIALPLQRFPEARRVYEALSQSIVEVRFILDAPQLAPLSFSTTKLDGLTVVGLRENPHHGLNIAIKRSMDLALAFAALICLAPVLLLLTLLVKCSSPGPVLYTQERCGLNGRRFPMLKFRTMRIDAELNTGPVWASANDDRTTSVGGWLRRLSLDELPQLWNVLRGDMSLVGPRPERPIFIERFRGTVPNYMTRLMVKAGMTGWAQVHGWRGNTSLRQRIRHDLYYITHWNPWFDLRILLLTLLRGFFHRNAY
jgi:Undecaprenyl-phosphate glucose phosphotransferase